ncbi:hypothetical protein Plec18170_009426, partial [Paecilomyces lecythidis]
DEELMGVLGWRAAHLTFETLKWANVPGQSRNGLLVDFWRSSTAHSQLLVVRGSYEHLKRLETQARQQLDVQTRQVLWKLYRLYALTVLVSATHELYASSALQVADIERANETIMQLLSDIRPHAVRLVDAWKLPDWLLDSSLGRYDGEVYEDMFHRASRQNPLDRLVIDQRPWSSRIVQRERQDELKSNL